MLYEHGQYLFPLQRLCFGLFRLFTKVLSFAKSHFHFIVSHVKVDHYPVSLCSVAFLSISWRSWPAIPSIPGCLGATFRVKLDMEGHTPVLRAPPPCHPLPLCGPPQGESGFLHARQTLARGYFGLQYFEAELFLFRKSWTKNQC